MSVPQNVYELASVLLTLSVFHIFVVVIVAVVIIVIFSIISIIIIAIICLRNDKICVHTVILNIFLQQKEQKNSPLTIFFFFSL